MESRTGSIEEPVTVLVTTSSPAPRPVPRSSKSEVGSQQGGVGSPSVRSFGQLISVRDGCPKSQPPPLPRVALRMQGGVGSPSVRSSGPIHPVGPARSSHNLLPCPAKPCACRAEWGPHRYGVSDWFAPRLLIADCHNLLPCPAKPCACRAEWGPHLYGVSDRRRALRGATPVTTSSPSVRSFGLPSIAFILPRSHNLLPICTESRTGSRRGC